MATPDILTNATFREGMEKIKTAILKGIGNSDLFRNVGDEQINVGDGTVSNAINVLDEKIDNDTIGFIDVSQGVKTRYVNDGSIPFTAPEDIWLNCQVIAEDSKWGLVCIDGVVFASTIDNTKFTAFLFPLKKGQTLSLIDCGTNSFVDTYGHIKL